MNQRIVFLFAFSMLLVFYSCNSESSATQTSEGTDTLTADELAMEAYMEAEMECLSNPWQICESGLTFVQLQDYIANIDVEKWEPKEIADSLMQESGYDWLQRTIHLSEGSIMIEGNFIDSNISNDTILSESQVNRIHVRSTLYQTRDQLRVGSTVSELLERYPEHEWLISAIPDYETIVLQTRDSRLIYHFADPGNQISEAPVDTFSILSLPQNLKVYSIVVM